MNLQTTRKTVSMLYRIAGNREKEIPCIPYYPQKTAVGKRTEVSQPFPRSTPERQGIPSALLAEFFGELSDSSDKLNPHTVMVLRNGSVIGECSFPPYEKNLWHVSHSMCKSIVSLAIGMLIDERKLSADTPVTEIFPEKMRLISAARKKDLTLRHLLTMSSGVTLNEAGSVTEEDWLGAFLESRRRFRSGSRFHYNSMNTYVLSEIVRKVSGRSLSEYLDEKLFSPLGIVHYLWEKSPCGTEKGGWGLYMLPEDTAKIGQLFCNKGVWKGRRIISEAYLKEAASRQVSSPEHMSDYGYGYQIWMGKRSGSCQFNGMLGQNVYILPDLNMVIVTTAGSGELFPSSLLSRIIWKYFGDGFRPQDALPEDPAAYQDLQNLLSNIQASPVPPPRLPPQAYALHGVSYHIYTKNTRLLPLFLQCLQNNHSSPVTDLDFQVQNDIFYLNIHEENAHYRIPVGFGEYRETTLDFAGELYLIKATGVFTTDEDDNPVLKLHIPFIETANSRQIKFFFLDGGKKLTAAWSESPDISTFRGLDQFISSGGGAFLSSLVEKAAHTDSDILRYLIRRSLNPMGRGECTSELPEFQKN